MRVRSASACRIVCANGSLACNPRTGGLWSHFLQFFLGLVDLGHDVHWLEVYRATGDASRDAESIRLFFETMGRFGLRRNCVVLLLDAPRRRGDGCGFTPIGKGRGQLEDIARSADLLLNFAYALRPPLVDMFKRRALVDGDPGHLQVSAERWKADVGQHRHDVYLTVGSKINDPDCRVPRLGLTWHAIRPPVYLPMWPMQRRSRREAPFAGITQWNWEDWEEPIFGISKRSAFLRCLDLPGRTQRSFELAANVAPDDRTGDRELLEAHGWRLVHPHDACASPGSYRAYVGRARAELCCAKGIYVHLRTGWFSERSAVFLASGRPVLAEATGLEDHYPTGEGLLTFRTLQEAAAGVAEIDAHYERHSEAARDMAAELLDSRKTLREMISRCSG